MIKLTRSIFMSSNYFFMIFFLTYIKISKDSSAKDYLNNKERQKKLVKDIKVFLKKKKKKSDNMVMNDTKISQKMKNKSLLSIEKKCYKMRKNALL